MSGAALSNPQLTQDPEFLAFFAQSFDLWKSRQAQSASQETSKISSTLQAIPSISDVALEADNNAYAYEEQAQLDPRLLEEDYDDEADAFTEHDQELEDDSTEEHAEDQQLLAVNETTNPTDQRLPTTSNPKSLSGS